MSMENTPLPYVTASRNPCILSISSGNTNGIGPLAKRSIGQLFGWQLDTLTLQKSTYSSWSMIYFQQDITWRNSSHGSLQIAIFAKRRIQRYTFRLGGVTHFQRTSKRRYCPQSNNILSATPLHQRFANTSAKHYEPGCLTLPAPICLPQYMSLNIALDGT